MSERAPAPRRPRLAGVILIALVGAALVALIASLSLDEGEVDPIEIEGAGEVQRLISGIRQLGPRLGSDSAPVTVEVFNDPQCESCADWQLRTLPPLIEGPVRDGEVKLVFRHFPITGPGLASYGALAAGMQGRQWQFLQLFLVNQGEAKGGDGEEVLDRVAAGVLELDGDRWRRDMEDPEIPELLQEDTKLAVERKLPGEPAIVVTGPLADIELIESPTLREIEAAIVEVSAASS